MSFKKMQRKIKGKAWKFGNNVDTDQMMPADYLTTADQKELAKHAFEKVRPEFAREVKKGDIIVAGKNFGCGSSREHAPRALIGSGIACVVAESFARIFYRNAINIGLPVVECTVEAKDDDKLEIDFTRGVVKNFSTNKSYTFYPMPKFLLEILETGGLLYYTKERLKNTAR